MADLATAAYSVYLPKPENGGVSTILRFDGIELNSSFVLSTER